MLFQAQAKPPDERVRGRERGVVGLERLAILAEVEVERARRADASMAAHALSLTDTNARPGGSMSAFCDPVTHRSMCQSSVRHSTHPSALMASTTKSGLGRSDEPAIRGDIVLHAGGGLAQRGADWLRGVGVFRERGGELLRARRAGP